MANRFQTPREQFFVNPVTGAALAGGNLYFYASGTTTPLNTYTDSGLTIANANPVILNSAGWPASGGNTVDIFLQNLAYTVVLTDSNNVPLWSADNVYTSDFSTVAVFGSYGGNPNGFVAGTAGSVSTNASTIWDYVNNILYVCTSTGSASTAIWTAVNSSTTTSSVLPPQGYLTLTSLTAIITSDVTGTSLVYYTPYVGNSVPIWNGSSFTQTPFSQLTLTLTAGAHIASTIYDVFAFNNAGVVTIGTGPAWTTSTAGSGARGSGAATTQLVRQNGLWTNSVSITLTNNGVPYPNISANQATYLGSIFIDTAAGQVSCYRSWGQSRKWGVWNAYNRSRLYLKAGDSTVSWSIAGTTLAPSHALTTNSLIVFSGLAEEFYDLKSFQTMLASVSGATALQAATAIGFNSTSAGSGLTNYTGINISTALNQGNQFISQSTYLAVPSLGINTITMLERYIVTVATAYGTEANHQLQAIWNG